MNSLFGSFAFLVAAIFHVAVGNAQEPSPGRTIPVPDGRAVRLTVQVKGGTRPFVYQWRKDGRNLAAATRDSFTLENFRSGDAGTYDVLVSNSAGTTHSVNYATLHVAGQDAGSPGVLANLSVLTTSNEVGPSVTLGYSVRGDPPGAQLPLLVRAVGPSLSLFGLTAANPDPRLELFSGSTQVGEQDDWNGNETVAAASSQVGAFALQGAASKDAAALLRVASGAHSVRVSGLGNQLGVVLAEIYDARAAADRNASSPRLVNLSVLKRLGSGFSVGFVIGGSQPLDLLLRAVGPSLASGFNFEGTLADPRLLLYAGELLVATNDNWGNSVSMRDTFRRAGAFALVSNSRDSALVHRSFPGSYTFHIQSVDATDGTVLLELYALPPPADTPAPVPSP